MMAKQLLNPDQKRRLIEFARSDVSASLRRRAEIILLYDQGLPTGEVARRAGLSPGRTRYWRRRFRAQGMTLFPLQAESDLPLHPGAQFEPPPPEIDTGLPGELLARTGMQAALGTAPASNPSASSEPAWENQRGEHVRSLALAIFDQTRHLHQLGEEPRQWLETAVRILPHPFLQDGKRDINALYKWIQTQTDLSAPQAHLQTFQQRDPSPQGEKALSVLSDKGRKMLAALLASRSGKLKKGSLAQLGLDPGEEKELNSLAAILRIAWALDHSGSHATQIERIGPVLGGTWIVVKGPAASEDAAAAEKQADLWNQAGYPRLQVLESAAAKRRLAKYPPLPGRMAQPEVEATDLMSEAGRKVMRFHFAEMLSHEAGTRSGEDIEELHDMRVATRRMRAAFEVFDGSFRSKALKPHLRGLRATGRALGHVRDLDVFMEKAHKYLESIPDAQRSGLDPLLEAWQSQREQTRKEMLAFLNSEDYQIFKQEFNLFLQTPGAGAKSLSKDPPLPSRVQEVAPVLIYSRLAAVRAFDAILENAAVEQLHALRIEFKKLRYTVEFFREVLGEEAKAIITELKAVQDHLGDLNDAVVATQILKEFLEDWETSQADLPMTERRNPEPIVNYLAARHAERYRLMVTFQEVWAHFNRPEFRRSLALAVSEL
jgi:CHAD domain-containing protein